MRLVRMPLLAAVIAVIMWVPGAATALDATPSGTSTRTSDATKTAAATGTYDLSFTLPTAGKSGCMVCHGDRNLVRIREGQTVSMWVSTSMLESSAHATIQCTGCHLDFAYSAPHKNTKTEDWRNIAKLACKNCHKEAFTAFSRGVHTMSPKPGQKAEQAKTAEGKPLPLCGDCHGSHDIRKLKDDPAGQEALHARGKEVCGDCHKDYWDNYADYYHGAAYRRGAGDAPACWQCHGAHDILVSTDRKSRVNEANLVETCGACHTNEPNEAYTSYAGLIHRRSEVWLANPVVAFLQRAFAVVRSWFGG